MWEWLDAHANPTAHQLLSTARCDGLSEMDGTEIGMVTNGDLTPLIR